MSKFDVAIGLNHSLLDNAALQFYNNPEFRNTYFRGVYPQKIEEIGDLNLILSYDVLTAPIFNLSPPTDEEWDVAQKPPEIQAKPAENLFQIRFPNIRLTIQLEETPPLVIEGAAKIYIVLGQESTNVILRPVGIHFDQSDLSSFDQFITNEILIPKGFEQAGNNLLEGFELPSIADITKKISQDVAFSFPKIGIKSDFLIIATNESSNTNAISLEDCIWPEEQYFALVSQGIINTFLNSILKKFEGQQKTGESSKGVPNLAEASADYVAKLKTISATVNSNNPTEATFMINLALSAHGGISGILPAVASGPCAVSTALNSI